MGRALVHRAPHEAFAITDSDQRAPRRFEALPHVRRRAAGAAHAGHADIVDVPARDVLDRAADVRHVNSSESSTGTSSASDGDGRFDRHGAGSALRRQRADEGADHDATYVAVTASQLLVVFGPAFRAAIREIPAVADKAIDEIAPSRPMS